MANICDCKSYSMYGHQNTFTNLLNHVRRIKCRIVANTYIHIRETKINTAQLLIRFTYKILPAQNCNVSTDVNVCFK